MKNSSSNIAVFTNWVLFIGHYFREEVIVDLDDADAVDCIQ